MDKQRAEELIRKYLDGTCTSEEKLLVEQWYNQAMDDQNPMPVNTDMESIGEQIYNQLPSRPKVRRLWPRIAAAASILLILSIGGYYFLNQHKPAKQFANNQPVNIRPGSNKAILTLSNGQKISLTDAKNGKVASQGNTVVKKTGAGVVEYVTARNNNESASAPIYNTLSTPRGGRFEGLLPDGTHVILDAASSIKYQVNVTGKDRLVWITGQVHFNVAYNEDKPFYVNVKGQVMKDLGTAFNINAYDDEPVIAVTLEEGSVSVTKNEQSVILIPGQQAVTKTADDKIRVQEVNVDDVIAWKNGQILFSGEDIQEIMRNVSRWYDVDIRYEGEIPARHFAGSISRNANLSDLLNVLEFDNVHFKLEGKTIIVKP